MTSDFESGSLKDIMHIPTYKLKFMPPDRVIFNYHDIHDGKFATVVGVVPNMAGRTFKVVMDNGSVRHVHDSHMDLVTRGTQQKEKMTQVKFKDGDTARIGENAFQTGKYPVGTLVTIVNSIQSVSGSGQICHIRRKSDGEYIGAYHSDRLDKVESLSVGDTVKILAGLFTGYTAKVTYENPADESYTVKLADEGKNGTLTISGKYLTILRKAREVGQTIEIKDIRVGDKIEVTQPKHDLQLTRVGVVSKVHTVLGCIDKLTSEKRMILWDSLWSNTSVKLMEEAKIDDLLVKIQNAPEGQIVRDGKLVAIKTLGNWDIHRTETTTSTTTYGVTSEKLRESLGTNTVFMKEEK